MRFRSVTHQVTNLTASIFLGAAILLGGASHPDVVAHLILQLMGLGLIAIAVFRTDLRPLNRSQWILVSLGFAFGTWTVLQLLPIPDTLWSSLPGRSVIKDGANLLGVATSGFAVSVIPERTLLALLGIAPPLAAFIWVCRFGWTRAIGRLQWAIPIFGAASVALGLAQVFAGPDSPLYFYRHTSPELPVGVFSNANHQATLCLMCLPFVFALAARVRRDFQSGDRDYAKALAIGVLGFANLLGVLAAGSVAGYAISVPVLVLSLLLFASVGGTKGNVAGVGGLIGVVAASALLVGFSPMLDNLGSTSFEKTALSRYGIWDRSGDVAADHIWVGSGLGTFRRVYALYEDPENVTPKYVNHAHNDYLQVGIESGLPGLVLLVATALFWLISSARIWTMQPSSETRLKQAATISFLVLLLHSVVDYPGRTPAIAALAAICLAIMVTPQKSPARRMRSKSNQPTNEKRIAL